MAHQSVLLCVSLQFCALSHCGIRRAVDRGWLQAVVSAHTQWCAVWQLAHVRGEKRRLLESLAKVSKAQLNSPSLPVGLRWSFVQKKNLQVMGRTTNQWKWCLLWLYAAMGQTESLYYSERDIEQTLAFTSQTGVTKEFILRATVSIFWSWSKKIGMSQPTLHWFSFFLLQLSNFMVMQHHITAVGF